MQPFHASLHEVDVGSGRFGTVRSSIHNGRPVAKKYILDEASASNELLILLKLDHPNVVKLFEYQRTGPWCVLFLELCGPNVFDCVLSGWWSLDHVDAAFYQVASAIAYIHSIGVVHRDIKAENVVVKAGGAFVLIDFGLAFAFPCMSMKHLSHQVGSFGYAAPEVIDPLIVSFDAYQADTWSLGMLFLFTRFGMLPFERADGSCVKFTMFRQALGLGVLPCHALHLSSIPNCHKSLSISEYMLINSCLKFQTRMDVGGLLEIVNIGRQCGK